MDQTTRAPGQIRISAHIVGWFIFFIAPLLLSPGRDLETYFSEPRIFTSLAIRNIILMIFFYANLFYITPRFFASTNQTRFFVILALLIVFIGTFNFFLHEFMTGSPGGPPPGPPPEHGMRFRHEGPRPGFPPRRLMLASPYFSSLLITALVAAASTLLVIWNSWMQAKATEQERSLQKVAAELSVLKLQISPHFLFNTLNNIRWLVRSKSDQAEPALVKLSQLLRYILYQTNAERVELIKEVEHLQDYVSLQRMRLPEKDAIEFTVTGEMQDKMIVPLLLIPIVENFFKHGKFDKGAAGKINLAVTGTQLLFQTQNTVLPKTENDEESSGIGIENVSKRLNLNYPGKHELKYFEKDAVYYLTLTINL
jgi:hypothetical protein